MTMRASSAPLFAALGASLFLAGGGTVVRAFAPGVAVVPPTASRSSRGGVAPLMADALAAPAKVEVADDGGNEDCGADLRACLDALEKRLRSGPGSVGRDEVTELEAAVDRIAKAASSAPLPPAAAASAPPASVGAASAAAAPIAPIAPATPPAASEEDLLKLHTAALQMDASTVSSLIDSGVPLSEGTTDAAFWAVVNAVDRAEVLDEPLPASVPHMLHRIFDADLQHLLTREQVRTNVTCRMPDDSDNFQGKMNYVFDDSSHKDLPLAEGRRCEDGTCCDKCSRNLFPTFATEREADLEKFPDMAGLTFNNLEKVPASTILQFVRLVERVRRTIAHEYGLDLSTVLPLQAYSRKYVAGTTQKGGGGGEGDFVILHTDEATHAGYHYSCVLYLSTQGEDFEGGDFVWNDPSDDPDAGKNDDIHEYDLSGAALEDAIRRTGRKLTPYSPTRGAAVIFSSGWENMHEVERITSGIRYCVPCFFTTCPVPQAAYDQMVAGRPKTDEDIADDWLHLLLAHREESPVESTGRVKELLMKWHMMCTPLSQH
ncbi:hypothetical protein ACHAWF_005221 [Thalassiosira exigua]